MQRTHYCIIIPNVPNTHWQLQPPLPYTTYGCVLFIHCIECTTFSFIRFMTPFLYEVCNIDSWNCCLSFVYSLKIDFCLLEFIHGKMDLITFIKKEEPVEYVLTTDDQGKVQELTISKEVKVTTLSQLLMQFQ